jgi:hypothetical protein
VVFEGSQEFCFFFLRFYRIFLKEFLYLIRIPPESGRIPVPAYCCLARPLTKEVSLLSKIWTKIDLFNLSPEQDLTMASAAPFLCWRLPA